MNQVTAAIVNDTKMFPYVCFLKEHIRRPNTKHFADAGIPLTYINMEIWLTKNVGKDYRWQSRPDNRRYIFEMHDHLKTFFIFYPEFLYFKNESDLLAFKLKFSV